MVLLSLVLLVMVVLCGVCRVIHWSGEYNADGVMMYYNRDGETEDLLLPGPLKRPLTFMVSVYCFLKWTAFSPLLGVDFFFFFLVTP